MSSMYKGFWIDNIVEIFIIFIEIFAKLRSVDIKWIF